MSRLLSSRAHAALVALAGLLIASCGDEPELAGAPTSTSMSISMSSDGLDASGDDTLSGDEPGTSTSTGGVPAAQATVYLHFDGGTFAAGPEDASLDQPGTIAEPGPFAPAPDFLDRAALTDTVATALAPYGVEVTTTRPVDGDYNMVVFLPSDADFVTAQANRDCGDHNPRNVGIVYIGGVPAREASAALAVTGQAFGLELTDDDSDVMSYVNYSATTFSNACVPVHAPAICPRTSCAMGEQNSHAELLAAIDAAG
jgi:hypothetical protein